MAKGAWRVSGVAVKEGAEVGCGFEAHHPGDAVDVPVGFRQEAFGFFDAAFGEDFPKTLPGFLAQIPGKLAW